MIYLLFLTYLPTPTMKHVPFLFLLIFACLSQSCEDRPTETANKDEQEVYLDVPFQQEYSVKYKLEQDDIALEALATDRNGLVQILSSDGLLHLRGGQFLVPGTIVADKRHRPLVDKAIAGITTYQEQVVYIDQEAIFSNAWAGSLFSKHSLANARLLCGGKDFAFLISNGQDLQLIQSSEKQWETTLNSQQLLDIRYQASEDQFWLLGETFLAVFAVAEKEMKMVLEEEGLTAFDWATTAEQLVVATNKGYFLFDTKTKQKTGDLKTALPHPDLTAVKTIGHKYWLGSKKGAFSIDAEGKTSYYHGERWLPDNEILAIEEQIDGSVLILSKAGLAAIHSKTWTLADKAAFYDKQVRSRHIRNGFNASLTGMKSGDISTGYLVDSDNDGLWTAMYLGGEAFRYAVTKSPEALQNCRESLDAMERLYTINPVPGFPSRSFERRGYLEQLADPDRWHHAPDPEWDWKGTTSSDEAIGHIFAFGVIAELIPDETLRTQAIALIDTLMQHVLDNDYYLVDYDGKPTTWGRWNPEYVNARPKMVGDRKLNASNITAMLQTAYHFTQKEIYKEKAFELLYDHGYLDNLIYPMNQVRSAPAEADDWSKMLSEEWNHSDDEMYFLGYWGLYRYAFNDSLKTLYKKAIIEHWEEERPEKEGLWNIFTAMTGVATFDMDEAAWYLREYPLDLIQWNTENSHRKDIELIEENFRGQTTKEVLPPDETRTARHNANRFTLDSGGNGRSEYSAGDIWLLPYWMGRYLEVISPPLAE